MQFLANKLFSTLITIILITTKREAVTMCHVTAHKESCAFWGHTPIRSLILIDIQCSVCDHNINTFVGLRFNSLLRFSSHSEMEFLHTVCCHFSHTYTEYTQLKTKEVSLLYTLIFHTCFAYNWWYCIHTTPTFTPQRRCIYIRHRIIKHFLHCKTKCMKKAPFSSIVIKF